MSTADVLVITGTIPLLLLSLLSYWITRGRAFAAHGREALLAWAALGIVIAATRWLDVTSDAIGGGEMRFILSVAYLSALIILCQIVFIMNGAEKHDL